MVTNINIDEKLLQEALALSDHSTVNLLIEAALREYIQRRQQLKVLELFGTIDYEENYNDRQQKQKKW
ncbi:MAG: type II toxin-antitoxin system VapB family antitoxin [Okeania sp. SIO3C4]|nr:type II toxin-antitoxin system VapB family antitoxin [Okeania sp. SIO3B3]NER03832.1 type II toxin-antitoxin system VapB family antitoxin [Okeania sp. SIO3C4]